MVPVGGFQFVAAERYEHAIDQRRVYMEPTPAGTANLYAFDLPPDRASALMRRINAAARSLRRGGEQRSMDQLRADVFIELSEGEPAGSDRRGTVDLTVDLATLTWLNDHPGELAGYGPVIADLARQITQDHTDAEWRYTITSPHTDATWPPGIGRVCSPAAACPWPVSAGNCIVPLAARCDHTTPWNESAPTTTHNLAPVCRHDHTVRHQAGWTYTTQPNGKATWTSRLGHTNTAKPQLALPP